MSKIANVRLPNASPQYDPQQFNQLVRSLEQVILQLNSNYTPSVTENTAGAQSWFGAPAGVAGFSSGIRGFQLSNGISLPHAMLMSTSDQQNASITGENLLTYDSVVLSNGITLESNSRIRVPCAGNYLVTFRLQLSNRGNATQEFEVWAKDTGVNYPNSNTRFDIPARKSVGVYSHVVPTVTGIFTVNDPSNDYLEIAWWSDSLDVFIEHYGTNTSPTRPAISSVILTINFISV